MTTEQRSFRLSAATLSLLDETAERTGESRNALAERLLGEALRIERHPLIRFQRGAAARSEPLLVGTRLKVHQVIATVRASKGDVGEAAEYLSIAPRLVRAAVDYFAEFSEEVEADAESARRLEEDERARWERQQRALV